LNEFSSKFESDEKSLLINTNDDIGTTSDSLQASDNGKSNDLYRATDSMNEVSMKPDDDKKSTRTVTHNETAICLKNESSFENEYLNRDATNCD
jgi:hypothetical protein